MKILRNNKSGFTLVELMIVVVILGILVAVAVPIFSAITRNAERKTCKNNMDVIEKAGTQYMLNESVETIHGIFIANAGGGTTTTSVTISSSTDAASKLSEDFLKGFENGEVPLCKDHNYTITIDSATDRSIRVTCSEHGTKTSS